MAADKAILVDIQLIISESRGKAYKAIDTQRVLMYWQIGKRILEEEQGGKDRAVYGDRLMRYLSQQLMPQFGSAFSERNLTTSGIFTAVFQLRTQCVRN